MSERVADKSNLLTALFRAGLRRAGGAGVALKGAGGSEPDENDGGMRHFIICHLSGTFLVLE